MHGGVYWGSHSPGTYSPNTAPVTRSRSPLSIGRQLSLDSQTAPPQRALSFIDVQDAKLTDHLNEFMAFAEHDRRHDDTPRQQGYHAIRHAVHHLFPDAIVRVTGSFVYGLHLSAPVSDLDLAIEYRMVKASDGLSRLYDRIRASPVFLSVTYLPRASTPVIKATVADSQVNIDIAWNVDNVDRAQDFVRQATTVFPLFKPITMYMKHYLYMFGFGNPYYGGLGSFQLYLLVIFHLQANAVLCARSVGACLRTFFGYYGSTFQVQRHCISVFAGGRPYDKDERIHDGPVDATRLCIENPFNRAIDVGRSAFNFEAIRQQMAMTFKKLMSTWEVTGLGDLTPHEPMTRAMRLVVALALACCIVVHGAKGRPGKRAHRVDPSLPLSSSHDIRDAIVLLEKARVALCEAEAELGLQELSRLLKSAAPPKRASNRNEVAHLVANADRFHRIAAIEPSHMLACVQVVAIQNFLRQTAYRIDSVLADYRHMIPDLGVVGDNWRLAVASSLNLSEYVEHTVHQVVSVRDAKFEDLPALRFWNATNVAHDEIVSVAKQIRGQVDLDRIMVDSIRRRNVLLEPLFATYVEYCDLVTELLGQPIVAAIVQLPDSDGAGQVYEHLTDAARLAADMKDAIIGRVWNLHTANSGLDRADVHLQNARTLVDHVEYMMNLVVAPDPPFEDPVIPAPNKKKATKKKKTKARGLPASNVEESGCRANDSDAFPSVVGSARIQKPTGDVDDGSNADTEAGSDRPPMISLREGDAMPTCSTSFDPVRRDATEDDLPSLPCCPSAVNDAGSVVTETSVCNPVTPSNVPVSVTTDEIRAAKTTKKPKPRSGERGTLSRRQDRRVSISCTPPVDVIAARVSAIDMSLPTPLTPPPANTANTFGDVSDMDALPITPPTSSNVDSRVDDSLLLSPSVNDVGVSLELPPTPSPTGSTATFTSGSVSDYDDSHLSPLFYYQDPASPVIDSKNDVDMPHPQSFQPSWSLDSEISPAMGISSFYESPDAQLTYDLGDFLTVFEAGRQRNDARYRQDLHTVERAVHARFPDAIVKVTGSFAYDLHLPAPISDLDLVILHPTLDASDGLLQLFLSVRHNPTFSSVKYISTASTPIIKATVADSHVKVDITWNVANVDDARNLVLEAMDAFPLFRPITMYVKYYLYMHGLGSPYYGGLGSFQLYLLVIFHLQTNAAICAGSAGACLRAFFEFYGSSFPVEQYCVSVTTDGRPLLKAVYHGPVDVACLCIQSPFDSAVDVGRSAYNFAVIRQHFYWTYRRSWEFALPDLTPREPVDPFATFAARKAQCPASASGLQLPRGDMPPGALLLVIALVVAVVHGAKPRPAKRTTATPVSLGRSPARHSRHTRPASSLPLPSSPAIQDAIVLLEQARVTLCEVEWCIVDQEWRGNDRKQTRSAQKGPAPPHRPVSTLVANAHQYDRIEGFEGIHVQTCVDIALNLERSLRTSNRIFHIVEDHAALLDDLFGIVLARRKAVNASHALLDFLATDVSAVMVDRDAKLEGLPALRFWDQAGVTPEEIVSAAAQIRDQADILNRVIDANRQRNVLLKQALDAFVEVCDVTSDELSRAIVNAAKGTRDDPPKSTMDFEELVHAAGLVYEEKERVAYFADGTQRAIYTCLDVPAERLRHTFTAVDRIVHMMDLMTCPPPPPVEEPVALSAPDKRKSKRKRKKQSRQDKQSMTDETRSIPCSEVAEALQDREATTEDGPCCCPDTAIEEASNASWLATPQFLHPADVADENTATAAGADVSPSAPSSSAAGSKKKKKNKKKRRSQTMSAGASSCEPTDLIPAAAGSSPQAHVADNHTAMDDSELETRLPPDTTTAPLSSSSTSACNSSTSLLTANGTQPGNVSAVRPVRHADANGAPLRTTSVSSSGSSPGDVTQSSSSSGSPPYPANRSRGVVGVVRLSDFVPRRRPPVHRASPAIARRPALLSMVGVQDAQLTHDLHEFVASVEEHRRRDNMNHLRAYQAVHQAVRDLFPGATVKVAGSVAFGLHLPSPVSDLDLVVQHPAPDPSNGLLRLFLTISGNATFSSVEYLPAASTPIIKATVANSRLNVDIAWNVGNLERTRLFIQGVMESFRLFKPIALYMKHYLYMHGLSTPYYGGLGSFQLYLLVAFHLQAHAASRTGSAGACLRAFFEFYGRAFQVDRHCVSVHTNGRPLLKTERTTHIPGSADAAARLCIESPFDAAVDVGRS
ncbi:hypothetical protein PBRA_006328, partial [Plasmodiophora brassicae]